MKLPNKGGDELFLKKFFIIHPNPFISSLSNEPHSLSLPFFFFWPNKIFYSQIKKDNHKQNQEEGMGLRQLLLPQSLPKFKLPNDPPQGKPLVC